jgi:hypothetical protein
MHAKFLTIAAVTMLSLGGMGAATAANMQGGNGSTGNPGTNNPAMVNDGSANMNMMHGSKMMPRCTSKRTHNCRHVSKKHMIKSM